MSGFACRNTHGSKGCGTRTRRYKQRGARPGRRVFAAFLGLGFCIYSFLAFSVAVFIWYLIKIDLRFEVGGSCIYIPPEFYIFWTKLCFSAREMDM